MKFLPESSIPILALPLRLLRYSRSVVEIPGICGAVNVGFDCIPAPTESFAAVRHADGCYIHTLRSRHKSGKRMTSDRTRN